MVGLAGAALVVALAVAWLRRPLDPRPYLEDVLPLGIGSEMPEGLVPVEGNPGWTSLPETERDRKSQGN